MGGGGGENKIMNQKRFDILQRIMLQRKYSINNNIYTGEIYSKFNNYKPMSGCFAGDGYLQVNLMTDGKQYAYKVHGLVAYAGGLDIVDNTVNHIDGVKTNNSIHNLEAISREDNLRHGHANGLYENGGSTNPRAILTEKKVISIREKYSSGEYTCKQLADEYGVKTSTIVHICTGRTWKNVGGPINKRDMRYSV